MLAIGFALLLAVSAIWPAMAVLHLLADLRGYPYASDDPATPSPFGFNHRSDTDYVAWSVSQTQFTWHGRTFADDWDGGQTGLDRWGEPAHWGVYAVSLGFMVASAIRYVAGWGVPATEKCPPTCNDGSCRGIYRARQRAPAVPYRSGYEIR